MDQVQPAFAQPGATGSGQAAPPGRHDILLLAVGYAICHFGILLIPDAYFWDDWVYYDTSLAFLYGTVDQLGSAFQLAAHVHAALIFLGPWSYKVLTFVLFFVAGWALHGVLARHAWLSRENRLLIVLFFLVLPFNSARIAHTVFQYTFSYALFFLAWLLIDRHRVVAAVLFFLSFSTNSLLVFYALPFLDVMVRRGAWASPGALARFLVRHLDLVLLPFVFFAIKVHFYSPHGVYAGYNAIRGFERFEPAAHLTRMQWSLYLDSLPLVASLAYLPLAWLLLRRGGLVPRPGWQSVPLLLTGLVAMLLAVAPYWLIGLTPYFRIWESRHQLLLPLGGALVVVGALAIPLPGGHAIQRQVRLGLAAAMTALCLCVTIDFNASAWIDWRKQQALIRLLALNDRVRSAKLVIFEDHTWYAMNLQGRTYRPYEWNGLMLAAYRDGEHRLGIPPSYYPNYIDGKLNHLLELHRAGQHVPTRNPQAVLVRIKADCSRPDAWCHRFPALSDLRLEVSEWTTR